MEEYKYICRNCGTITIGYQYTGDGLTCCPERDVVEEFSTGWEDVEWGWRLCKEKDNLKAENKKLRDYANHKDDCNIWRFNVHRYKSDNPCTCGLDNLLKESK